MRSLPTPGPLQNANSPITTGTAQAETLRPALGLAQQPDRQAPALPPQPGAAGWCPAVAWSSGWFPGSGLMPSSGSSAQSATRPEPGLLCPLLNQNLGSRVTEKPFLCPGGWHLRTLGPTFRP